MDYEIFKKVIAERIKEFLPPVFHSYQVSVTTVRKINQKKDTLLVIPEDSSNIAALPNIYLDDMYEAFSERQDLDEVLRFIAALIIHYTGSFKTDQLDLDFRGKKDSIVMNLINTERNQELLQTVPHKEIMDLSIIYRIIMGKEGDGLATVLVDHRILEELNMGQEELEQLAYANTGRMFPPEIFKLSDILYVMTNVKKIHGATTMMYREAVELLANKIGGNFFVIPSSIHEVLAVPEEQSEADKLLCMLKEGNQICGCKGEILSNTIYHYDCKKKLFTVAASYRG